MARKVGSDTPEYVAIDHNLNSCAKTLGRPQAVVEIVAEANGEPPAEFIQALYRASAQGVIKRILCDVAWAAVDHVLDNLVHQMPLSVPGLIYLKADDEAAVVSAIASTDLILAATARFQTVAMTSGFTHRPEQAILPSLSTMLMGVANPAPELSVRLQWLTMVLRQNSHSSIVEHKCSQLCSVANGDFGLDVSWRDVADLP